MKQKAQKFTFIILFLSISQALWAQNKAILDPDAFNEGFLSSLILKHINEYRISQGNESLESNKLLGLIAEDQALYMATHKELTDKNKGKKKTTAKRAIYYGATQHVGEVIGKTRVRKGKEYFTYHEIAEEIAVNWISKKKYEAVLNDAKYMFVGISPYIDKDGKTVYVSIVFGNYYSFNTGAKKREFLHTPFTTKKYGLKAYERKNCRKCNKFEDWQGLQNALFIKDGVIYFRYHEYRDFKRLIRNKKDGIAVDIVQKEQYRCDDNDNIVNYNLPNKGVLLKPMYSAKLLKKNRDKSKRPKEMYVALGNFPEEIKGDYEFNLLLIQNKHVCKTVTKTYTEVGESELFQPLQLVPDTVSIKTNTTYIPIPDTNYISFRIPFEQGKYNYDPKDIEPFISALKEPDFTILEVDLIAVSSLEGSEAINEELQKKRAESIVDAIKKRQNENIISSVSTNNGWELFRADILETKYAKMSDMTFEDARAYMIKKGLVKELEPILSKHRFAEVDLRVVYDIAGEKEQFFVVDKFNKTIKKEDIPFAFAMQRLIIDKAVAKVYGNEALANMEIPEGAENAPLQVNKLFLEHISTDNKLDPDFCIKITKLHEQAPNNPYIKFNKLCCDVKNQIITNPYEIRDRQQEIKEFYALDIPKEYVDNLNLNFQFKIIKYTDTLEEPTKTALAAFEKIKSIVKIEETNMESCLELAKLFIKYNDFQFAGRLLDKFVNEEDVSEEYVFTYLSVCSHVYAMIMSKNFVAAQKAAARLNHERYCKLFNGDNFSFQVFDNPAVKETHCKTCKH